MKEESIYFLFFFKKGALMQKESKFQAALIKEIKKLLPGSYILKNDPLYIQGIPDLLILYKNKWELLECKRSAKEKHQPNQEYYIEKFGEMSFASFIYPENKEEVLRGLQQALGVGRDSRISKR